MSGARRSRAAAAGAGSVPIPVFAALGDRTRLFLVAALGQGRPLSITRLTEGAAVTRQAIRKHLRVLERAGLVRGARRGRETLFRLEPAPLDDARRYLDRVSAQWDRALARLRSLVEAGSVAAGPGRRRPGGGPRRARAGRAGR